MKRVFWWIGLVGLALLVVACGPAEPIIEGSAAEMNLTAEELGESFVLEEEFSFEDIVDRVGLEEPGAALDAQRRTFLSADIQVDAVVLIFNASKQAQNGLEEVRQHLELPLQAEAPTLLFQDLTAPDIGDEVAFAKADVPGGETQNVVYLFAFRKRNVVGFVVASGTAEMISEEWVRDIGLELFTLVPEPPSS